ncbi:MAG: excinuclease ABC subunit UvrB [Vampirovibrio sp.]
MSIVSLEGAEPFKLHTPYAPAGDQPTAIAEIVEHLQNPATRAMTLLGATGTGKTFTMASVIQHLQRPTLIMAHNKTLAAQLYNEIKEFFPENAVEYFISYYDFYQPEAYIPRSDTYIEKTATINEEIDRMRHSATRSLFERRDVIVVSSVSCIYGLGMPEVYLDSAIRFEVGVDYEREALLHQLLRNQYMRNDLELTRSHFRMRGDVIDVFPANEEVVLRLEFFDETLESIYFMDSTTGEVLQSLPRYVLYPAVHYVTDEGYIDKALSQIKLELKERLAQLVHEDKNLEAQRLEQRTLRDMESIKELGYCPGVENYSRIFEGRPPGSPPKTLIDYFPSDMLMFIDESHVTIPQLRGMYHGDRSRKQTLVDYGFRLPCAQDNRPLIFDEFMARVGQLLYVSATPSRYELAESAYIAEQVIRPTGLLDPLVEVCPIAGQVDKLVSEIEVVLARDERVLITTLTKRMAEDLSEYMQNMGLQVRYLHSDIKPMERVQIIQDLRLGHFDILVGVNLLREGLDLPEVSLVCIMDADKEGFLRSDHALIQTIGRAARNAAGRVILFADKVTPSMQRAMEETSRRRQKQMAHNTEHGVVPVTIKKEINNGLLAMLGGAKGAPEGSTPQKGDWMHPDVFKTLPADKQTTLLEQLEAEMKAAAKLLDFDKATALRDTLFTLRRV